MPFMNLFDQAVTLRPEHPFLVMDDHRVTYRQAAGIANRIANGLAAKGVRRGDRAVVLSENTIAACLAILGCMRAGCVWTTVDVAVEPAEFAANLRRLEISAVFYSRSYQDRVSELCAAVETLRCSVELSGDYEDGLDAHTALAADTCADAREVLTDTATLFASGGSTGKPRNALATHACWQIGLANLLAVAPEDQLVNSLVMPLTHIAGATVLLFTMARGGTVVVVRKFDPDYLANLIEAHRVSFLALPPTGLSMLVRRAKHRPFDFSSLKTLIHSGAPSQRPMVLEAFELFGSILATSYGQTETTVPITALLQRDHAAALAAGDEALLASCGRMLPMCRVGIMDDFGTLLGAGESGEIVVRGGHVMSGYCGEEAETERVSRFGWHHTGDLGRLDERGYLYILDRKREMIISGGYNVFPRQIEEAALTHPAVSECVVIGVPHEVLGETVKAIIVTREDRQVSEVELKSLFIAKVGPIRAPSSIEFWPQLPRTSSGKVARGEIRERFWRAVTRRI